MDGTDVSYSDHDVHHIVHEVEVSPGTGGDNVTDTSVGEFEITERGIDPDELAELRAMRVQVGAKVDATQDQTERGVIEFGIDAGYNLSDTEGITGQGTGPSLDPDGDGTDEINTRTGDTDEVGQIWSYADAWSIGYDDSTDGQGAGQHNNASAEIINMSDLFGSGPFVDSADDFNSIITFGINNVVERFGVQVLYTLYYNVEETEGGRTRFGR